MEAFELEFEGHPLKLIDLQVKDVDVEESNEDEEEEEEDLVVQDEFVLPCKLCGQEINEYYRYYYKCVLDHSCDFHFHKFCAELPVELKHPSHPHPLTRIGIGHSWKCLNCKSEHEPDEFCYFCFHCFYYWDFHLDVNCILEGGKRRIYHPSHPHPLVSLFSKPILCECNVCGKEHKGVFFLCTTCSNFAVHTDCAFLPKKLLIQNTTNNIFHHTHPLTISYSFPEEEKLAKYYPKCRVCGGSFDYYKENICIYKCEKCIYYAHVDCATSRKEPFMSIISIGKGKNIKNFEDVDYPNLLHLPFPDETYNIPKHLFSKQIRPTTYEVSLQHISHQHELILVDTLGPTSSKINSLIMCHNPMKRIELLCNGCLRPITEMPFYTCGVNEEEGCNFALHEWCTRLPTKVDNHPGHPQHTLVLMSNVSHLLLNTFRCVVCRLACNGFAYGCSECEYYVDVTCAFMPAKITHKSHPNHLLTRVKIDYQSCLMCLLTTYDNFSYNCSICDVYIHPHCALLLPEKIRNTCDKHPLHLSYLPIENHKSEYFCEICESELNPNSSFYHCDECVQSVHCACAPIVLPCETQNTSTRRYGNNIYWYLNIKFGSIHKTKGHPHPLSLALGVASDGQCSMCSYSVEEYMIFRCTKCEFVIDCSCYERWNKS